MARDDLAVQTATRSQLVFFWLFALTAACVGATSSQGQELPKPVYWSQQVFMIPYTWEHPGTASQASAVKLYLSVDQGASWNEIAKGDPKLQGFKYQAPTDGEYWFSIRTYDAAGNVWPRGPHQPELRVIVDTENPTVSAFTATMGQDGLVNAEWQALDRNLAAQQTIVEYRTPTSASWLKAPITDTQPLGQQSTRGSSSWRVPTDSGSVWIRLSVRDNAGNVRQAGAEAKRGVPPRQQLAMLPSTNAAHALNSPRAPGSYSMASTTRRIDPPGETWPSDGESQVPLGTNSTNNATSLPSTPALVALPSLETPTGTESYSTEPQNSPFRLPQLPGEGPTMRTASARGMRSGYPENTRPNASVSPSAGWTATTAAPLPALNTSNLPTQHLNSLDFEIGFNVDTAGTAGVTRVELWATQNGGQSWQRLAVDTDNRSPIMAAVPKPGDYGLAIVVATAGGIDPVRPRPGDTPQMLVRVDTTLPVAKLTGVEQGRGAMADHLIIRWLPANTTSPNGAAETVKLAYSTSPNGPWVTAAERLANNGQYAWRLARHVPTQFYLRLEVADPAGNTAGDQTQVPVQVTLPTPSGTLGTARGL